MSRLNGKALRRTLGMALALMASAALAEEHSAWDLALGLGVDYSPDYSGANSNSPRLRIWADGAYRTANFGTFALDSGSLTIAPEARWDFVDSTNFGIGLLIGYRAGRDDQDPKFASATDGSTRLRGLPDVGDTLDYGIAGHVTIAGIPLFAQLRSAFSGGQGTILTAGLYLKFTPAQNFELTVLPTVTAANSRQMQAFYGVSPAAAAASGFAVYQPGGGWQNAAIEVVGDWRIAGPWHFIASIAYQRLLGKAADSPVVQTANQPSALAGVVYDF